MTPQVEQWYVAEHLEDVLAENPAYASLRQYEPTTFRTMLASGKQSIREGAPIEAIQASMRVHLMPVIERSIPIAEDHAVYGYMKVMTKEIRELHAGGDEACYTFLNPGTGAVFDATRRFQPETLRADLEALGAVIRSAATTKQARVGLKDVQPQLARVTASLAEKYGAEADLLNAPQSTMRNKRRACELVAFVYDEVLALPPNEGGRVLRAMLSE